MLFNNYMKTYWKLSICSILANKLNKKYKKIAIKIKLKSENLKQEFRTVLRL